MQKTVLGAPDKPPPWAENSVQATVTEQIHYGAIQMPMTMEQRETQLRLLMPDATADEVAHRLRQQEAYIGGVVSQSITDTTTTFAFEGWRVKERPELWPGPFFSFPPNDPKYLAEFVRALNYRHLFLSIYFSHLPGTELSGHYPANIIDWMEVFPAWHLYSWLFPLPHEQIREQLDSLGLGNWNEVKIDRWHNTVKIGT
jgi:hypothetical protein